MKYILSLLLLSLSFFATGQNVNKNILGLKVGGFSYPQGVSRSLERKYQQSAYTYQKSSSYAVLAKDIPFAGYIWDKLTVNITSDYHIAEVILLEVCEHQESADMLFYDLSEKLEAKYGSPTINRINSKHWGEGTCVSIDRIEVPSSYDSSKSKYKVELSYYNEKYSAQLSSDIIDEL